MVEPQRHLFYVQLEGSTLNSVAVFQVPADATVLDLKKILTRGAPFMVLRPDDSYSARMLADTCKLRDLADVLAIPGDGRCRTRPFVFMGRNLLELLYQLSAVVYCIFTSA